MRHLWQTETSAIDNPTETREKMNRRTRYLLLRTGIGAGIGIILSIPTGDLRLIPIGAAIGALSQFASYGFRGYFRL